MYLGETEARPVRLRAISSAFGISEHHVTKVAQSLAKHGYIHTSRGRSGGIWLKMPPNSIVLGMVFRHLEPSLRIAECFNPATNHCPLGGNCSLQAILADARDAFLGVLDRCTLADLLTDPGSFKSLLKI